MTMDSSFMLVVSHQYYTTSSHEFLHCQHLHTHIYTPIIFSGWIPNLFVFFLWYPHQRMGNPKSFYFTKSCTLTVTHKKWANITATASRCVAVELMTADTAAALAGAIQTPVSNHGCRRSCACWPGWGCQGATRAHPATAISLLELSDLWLKLLRRGTLSRTVSPGRVSRRLVGESHARATIGSAQHQPMVVAPSQAAP
jgi:hypothetical protein